MSGCGAKRRLMYMSDATRTGTVVERVGPEQFGEISNLSTESLRGRAVPLGRGDLVDHQTGGFLGRHMLPDPEHLPAGLL